MTRKADLVIRNGRVIDGTGNPWYRADVAVADGRIIKIERPVAVIADEEIDASDNVIAPGFIDFHSHADFVLPVSRHLDILSPLLLQGITTLITGNCGFSPAPLTQKFRQLLIDYTESFSADGLEWNWYSINDYLSELERRGVGVNIAQYVGHSAIRNSVMGFAQRIAGSSELKQMQRLLDQSLSEGAYGLSIGLLYTPSSYANPKEFVALGEVVASHDALLSAHLRAYSEQLIPCIKELASIGREARCKLHVSHMHGLGKANWHRVPEALSLFDELRKTGLDITFDIFGYIGGGSTITALFPPWSLEGGTDRLLERLEDPKLRKRMQAEMEGAIMPDFDSPDAWLDNLVRNVGWQNLYIISVSTDENKGIEGMTVDQIARKRQTSPFNALTDITKHERGNALFNYVGASGDLKDDSAVQQMIRHPYGSLITDAIITGRGKSMPYAYNMFPRILGRYVRDLKILPLEECVRKMTSESAKRLGIKNRGLLLEGFQADITIFNPDIVAGRASLSNPDLTPEGISYVLINGQLIVKDGRVDSKRNAGQVMRRS
jgi:N-acyl-D-amino-acid deacylase